MLICPHMSPYTMVSRKEQSTMRLMHTLIIKYGYLNRLELQKKSGNLSIGMYNKLKSYFEEIYQDTVGYDKSRKIWYAVNPMDEKVREHLIELELITE